MKKITKILEYLVYAALIFMALLVLASALPIPGGIKTFVVRSGSMLGACESTLQRVNSATPTAGSSKSQPRQVFMTRPISRAASSARQV